MPANQSLLTGVLIGIRALLDTKMAVFVVIGLNWTTWLAVLKLLFDAMNGLGKSGSFHDKFFTFFQSILYIVFVRLFLIYYDTPMPYWGSSFSKILIDESTYLTNLLDVQSVTTIWAAMDDLWSRMELPSLWAWMVFVPYLGLLGLMLFTKAVMLVVIAGSYISFAVATVLGPLFLPWLIFPQTAWITTGWFRATLEFAFIPVVALAYEMVMAQFVLAFLATVPPSVTVAQFGVYLYEAIVMVITLAVGTLSIPSLTTSLFSGRAQHHHIGGLALALLAR